MPRSMPESRIKGVIQRAAKMDQARSTQIERQKRTLSAMLDFLQERNLVDDYNEWFEANREKYSDPTEAG